MLKLNYFLADIFILSAEKQPIKLSWRKIECLQINSNSLNLSKTAYDIIYFFYQKNGMMRQHHPMNVKKEVSSF